MRVGDTQPRTIFRRPCHACVRSPHHTLSSPTQLPHLSTSCCSMPGEKQLEIDKRLLRDKAAALRKELEAVGAPACPACMRV